MAGQFRTKGGTVIGGGGTPNLLNALVSYWKLDEASTGAASVTRNDSQGTNHLNDPLKIPSNPSGIINNAVGFAVINGYLIHTNNASLQVTGDYTFSAWVLMTDVGVTHVIVAKSDFTTVSDYYLFYIPLSGFRFSPDGLVTVDVGTNATVGVWYHLVCWYDSSDGKGRLRVNDATTYVSTPSSGLVQGPGDFTLGGTPVTPSLYLSGRVDEVGFWKRKLTAAEITALYNGGAGLPFSSFTT